MDCRKYEILDDTKMVYGHQVHRIRALRDFGDVKAGDLGGWVEKEVNLSHSGTAWVYDDAVVFGNARVYDDAQVSDNAQVCDRVKVYGEAWVYGYAKICDETMVCDNAKICGTAIVNGHIKVNGNTVVRDASEEMGLQIAIDITSSSEKAKEPSSREDILAAAKVCVCGYRVTDYGKPENNFGTIAELWTTYLHGSRPEAPAITAEDVAMMLALLKVGRISSGTGSMDCFVDLAGYAACAGEIAAETRNEESSDDV